MTFVPTEEDFARSLADAVERAISDYSKTGRWREPPSPAQVRDHVTRWYAEHPISVEEMARLRTGRTASGCTDEQ